MGAQWVTIEMVGALSKMWWMHHIIRWALSNVVIALRKWVPLLWWVPYESGCPQKWVS